MLCLRPMGEYLRAEVLRTVSRGPHKERQRARVSQSSWLSEALCSQVGKGKQ